MIQPFRRPVTTGDSAVRLIGQRGVMESMAVIDTRAVSGSYAVAVDEQPPGNETAVALMRPEDAHIHERSVDSTRNRQ